MVVVMSVAMTTSLLLTPLIRCRVQGGPNHPHRRALRAGCSSCECCGVDTPWLEGPQPMGARRHSWTWTQGVYSCCCCCCCCKTVLLLVCWLLLQEAAAAGSYRQALVHAGACLTLLLLLGSLILQEVLLHEDMARRPCQHAAAGSCHSLLPAVSCVPSCVWGQI